MPQLNQLSGCPSCAEPLEEGDLFCGACGAELAAAAQHVSQAGRGRATVPGAPPPPTAPPAVPTPTLPSVHIPPPPSAPPAAPTPTEPDFTLPTSTVRQPPPGRAGQGGAEYGAAEYGPPPQYGAPAAVPPAQAPEPPAYPPHPRPAPPVPETRIGVPAEGAPAAPVAPPAEAPQPEEAPAPPPAPDPRADARPVLDDFAPRAVLDDFVPRGQQTAYEAAMSKRERGPDVPTVSDAAFPSGEAPAPAPSYPPPGAPAPAVPAPAVPAPAVPAPAVPAPAAAPSGAAGPHCVACGTGTVDSDGYCEHCGHKQPLERDHMERALPSVAVASDRGLRHHRNEDFFSVLESFTASGSLATIAVVCDGVSSATRPDDASAAAAKAAGESMGAAVPHGAHPQQIMHDALVAAAEAVTHLASEGPNEPSKNAPACTIVSALTAEGVLTVGWIGDSRAYWVPDDRSAPPARLTEDDSWAAQMVSAGLMTEAEAYADARAHAITGWLGADAHEVDPHTASFKPDRSGVVIVCTDGLWNYAESAEDMAAVVPQDAHARPLPCAQHLVGYALDGGGMDNITVAVVPFAMPD
ncbi:PP2C family serine/threonine-protein phosphatase [Streptomyces sp. HNM0574]|uniref:PP2C family protein-serine/threonine phosphatase n=1 Tax=Streptomyces sp. HNM0574 TaxID=2714954 RepID=UPI00146C3F0E|nr:PP2C family serine/threonine-protein phosphatase [Streptomyces sp. HNM0574]NLU66413.1 serine/threonine-protein phosphatase [Streptomyces sp. HNM0574]